MIVNRRKFFTSLKDILLEQTHISCNLILQYSKVADIRYCHSDAKYTDSFLNFVPYSCSFSPVVALLSSVSVSEAEVYIPARPLIPAIEHAWGILILIDAHPMSCSTHFIEQASQLNKGRYPGHPIPLSFMLYITFLVFSVGFEDASTNQRLYTKQAVIVFDTLKFFRRVTASQLSTLFTFQLLQQRHARAIAAATSNLASMIPRTRTRYK